MYFIDIIYEVHVLHEYIIMLICDGQVDVSVLRRQQNRDELKKKKKNRKNSNKIRMARIKIKYFFFPITFGEKLNYA